MSIRSSNIVNWTIATILAGNAAIANGTELSPTEAKLLSEMSRSNITIKFDKPLTGCLTDGVMASFNPIVKIKPSPNATAEQKQTLKEQAEFFLKETWTETVEGSTGLEMLTLDTQYIHPTYSRFAKKLEEADNLPAHTFKPPVAVQVVTVHLSDKCQP